MRQNRTFRHVGKDSMSTCNCVEWLGPAQVCDLLCMRPAMGVGKMPRDIEMNIIVGRCISAGCFGRPGSEERRFVQEPDSSWTCGHCSRRYLETVTGDLVPAGRIGPALMRMYSEGLTKPVLRKGVDFVHVPRSE